MVFYLAIILKAMKSENPKMTSLKPFPTSVPLRYFSQWWRANWYRSDNEFFSWFPLKDQSGSFFSKVGTCFSFLCYCVHTPFSPLSLSTYSFLLFWDFFFLASTPGWQYFSSRLLHAISLKIIWVKLLAEVLALEEHQLFRAWKVLCLFYPGLSSGINPWDWIGWWRYIDLWEEMAI